MTIAALKVNLIQQITHIEDSALLMQLDKIIHELHQEDTAVQRLSANPTRPFLDLENLKKEQNYNFDEAKFDKLIKKLDIQEPYEVLVEMI